MRVDSTCLPSQILGAIHATPHYSVSIEETDLKPEVQNIEQSKAAPCGKAPWKNRKASILKCPLRQAADEGKRLAVPENEK